MAQNKKIKIAELKNIIHTTILEQINKEVYRRQSRYQQQVTRDLNKDRKRAVNRADGTKGVNAEGEQVVWSNKDRKWLKKDESTKGLEEGWSSVRRMRGRGLDDDQYEGAEDFQPDDGDTKTNSSGEKLIWSADAGQWLHKDEWVVANKAEEAGDLNENMDQQLDLGNQTTEDARLRIAYAQMGSLGKNQKGQEPSLEFLRSLQMELTKWARSVADHSANVARKSVDESRYVPPNRGGPSGKYEPDAFDVSDPEDRYPQDGEKQLIHPLDGGRRWLYWSSVEKNWLEKDEYIAARDAAEGIEESAPMAETPEAGKQRVSTTFGKIPDEHELYDLMNGEDFDMDLKGADAMAWEYAMALDPNPNAGSTSAGKGLRASLQALTNAPNPKELTDEQFEAVEHVLDRWYHSSPRYHEDYSIEDAAQSLASSIMSVLNVEWV